MNDSKVMIVVPTGMQARDPEFYDDLARLQLPNSNCMSFRSHGKSPAKNRNIGIEMAVRDKFTHVMFFDDDVSFKPDTLIRLLSHDKDVVTGLYLGGNYPHLPLIFDRELDNGKNGFHFFSDNESGLIPISNCGLGAVLIKIDVFRKLEPPYIRLGQLTKDEWCDDIEFFNRVRQAGFKLFCDLECPIGHYFRVCFWPNRTPDGKWNTVIDSSGTDLLAFKQPHLEEVIKSGRISKEDLAHLQLEVGA